MSKRRFWVGLEAAWIFWVLAVTPASAGATAEDSAREQTMIATLLEPSGARKAVEDVRRTSPFVSTLPSDDLTTRLAGMLRWMVRDYANSGALRLLSAAPDGTNAAGATNTRLRTLQHTYWLQDNALYGAGAWLQYAPPLGRLLSESWQSKWARQFPDLCPGSQSDMVVGTAPAYDGGPGALEARCRIPRPGVWQMLRMRQFPSPDDDDFDRRPLPIIGTDHPGVPAETDVVAIGRSSTRDLLKYGCLRQVVLGNLEAAQEMFDLALAQWDGNGFLEAKNRHNATGRSGGLYWTRDLAFAALCANALGQGGQKTWGRVVRVEKALIEQRLWATQAGNGGLWTNYCVGSASEKCQASLIPRMAKETNEIVPLVLLVYGKNIWQRTSLAKESP
jgi:hypothetical protein